MVYAMTSENSLLVMVIIIKLVEDMRYSQSETDSIVNPSCCVHDIVIPQPTARR